jgi:hypothetical protein
MLSPDALAALLLPLPPRLAARLTLATWTSRRPIPVSPDDRWSSEPCIVAGDVVAERGGGAVLRQAELMAQALLCNEPHLVQPIMSSEAEPPATAQPQGRVATDEVRTRQEAAAASFDRDGWYDRLRASLPCSGVEALRARPGARIDLGELSRPASECLAWIAEFASDVHRRFVDPDVPGEMGWTSGARDSERAWQYLERLLELVGSDEMRPWFADPEQWQQKAEILLELGEKVIGAGAADRPNGPRL